MPYVNIYIHFVWSTKDRLPFLNSPEIRKKVWSHIKENARNKGIIVDMINGYSDHCHCLISLQSDQTISQIVKLIKGESSYWINKENLIKNKFAWQSEYFASSVSQSNLQATREYIKNQEEHHKVKTFKEEYDDIMIKFGFTKP